MDFGFLAPTAFFAMIVWIVKIVSDNKIRRKVLENGNVTESLKYLWRQSYANKPLQNIKWAIMIGGVGLMILISYFFALSETVAIGLSCIVIALALMVYYYMEKNKS